MKDTQFRMLPYAQRGPQRLDLPRSAAPRHERRNLLGLVQVEVAGATPGTQVQWIWAGPDNLFLASSLATWLLLAQEPHLEN